MTRNSACLLLCLSLLVAGWAHAQEAVVQWAFEGDTGGWQSADPASQIRVTSEPAVARVEGASVAEYAYEIAAGKIAGVATQVTVDLARTKSLRFWLRTSAPTMVLVNLSEKDGSSYMAPFFSLAELWQDIAIDFSDFKLSDDSQDENGLLDPGQIGSLGLIDVSSFLAEMAAKVPFLVPPEMGPRKLWLDDVAVDTENVLPRWEAVEVEGLKGVRLESFEGMPLQWLLISAGAMKVEYDDQVHAHGSLSLRVTYDLPAGKLLGLMTSPGTAPIGSALRLRVSLRSEAKTTLLIGLKEEDGSQYNALLPVEAGQELKAVDLPLAEFKLGDDSADEDGKLSPAEVSEFGISDASGIMGQPVGHNTLWLDDILLFD